MAPDTLVLRGHHLGCVLAGFAAGSDHPTVPVAIAWLRDNPRGTIRVVVGPDDICLPCPEWDGETCGRGFEELNQGKDRMFLGLLGMDDGERLPARDVFSRLCERATSAFWRETCPGCSPDKCDAAARAGVPF
jgi:hypothetical protein